MARMNFTVEAGRQIYLNGHPFIGIQRQGETQPHDADVVTHEIAALLNKHYNRRTRSRRSKYSEF